MPKKTRKLTALAGFFQWLRSSFPEADFLRRTVIEQYEGFL
jgi:hypothetical protein